MKLLNELFDNNQRWAERIEAESPDFFEQLSKQQNPQYLWIGCSDSRVPANDIVGLLPGELFVHRNVANLVVHTDMNCMSVLQYAVEVLKVKHIIVCGHYGCGGVATALGNEKHGLIDTWLRNIKDVYVKHQACFTDQLSEEDRTNLLCELNVIEQVHSISKTTIVQDAWNSGQKLAIHGWIYSIKNGLLKDLNVCLDSSEEVDPIYRVSTSDNAQR